MVQQYVCTVWVPTNGKSGVEFALGDPLWSLLQFCIDTISMHGTRGAVHGMYDDHYGITFDWCSPLGSFAATELGHAPLALQVDLPLPGEPVSP